MVIVSASATDPADAVLSAIFWCVAEWFMKTEHCLIVYDDLSKQAAAYRGYHYCFEGLGREAYPGDVFAYSLRGFLKDLAKLNDDLGADRYRIADYRNSSR